MDYFLKQYKQVCKEEFSGYGFKSYRNNHYRVVNDVFQSFCLHRSVYGKSCTVEFGILPLATEYTIEKDRCRSDHLKKFEGVYEWFEYDNRSEPSIDRCISEMLVYMKKYLMPFFERGIDCKTAYKEICDFERNHCKIYNLADDAKFCMALKNGDYKNAVIHLKAQIAHTKGAYANVKSYYDDMGPEYEEMIRLSLEKDNRMLEHILNGDETFIKNYIEENERRNLENLKWKSPIVKAPGNENSTTI